MHALCWPLLTADDGSKIGKTTGARVWLDPELTSPYAFFQHWINTEDAAVERMLAQFTLLPMPEIAALLEEHAADPGRRVAQRVLAREVTDLVHGAEARQAAEEASEILFGADPRRRPRPRWPWWLARCRSRRSRPARTWAPASRSAPCSSGSGWRRPRAMLGVSSSRAACRSTATRRTPIA